MKRSFITGLALEDDQAQTQTPEEIDVTLVESPELPVEDDIPEDVIRDDIAETVVDNVSDDIADEFDQDQRDEVVLESLVVYHQELQALINNKKCSLESLAFIEYGINREFSNFGLAKQYFALEAEQDPTEKAKALQKRIEVSLEQLALEGGISGYFLQPFVIDAKRIYDGFSDVFKSTTSMKNKYNERLLEAEKELKALKWEKDESAVTLNALWDFYTLPKAGQTGADFVKAMQEDYKTSEFIIVKYTKAVIDEVRRALKMIEDKDFAKIIKNVSSLKTAVQLFDNKILSKQEPLLGAVALGIEVGHSRDRLLNETGQHVGVDLIVGGINAIHEKMNGTMTPYIVAETKLFTVRDAMWVPVVNVFASVVKSIRELKAANRPINFTKKDAQEIVEITKKYAELFDHLNSVKTELMSLQSEVEQKVKMLETRYDNKEDNGMMSKLFKNKEFKQVKRIISNLMLGISHPSFSEIGRICRVIKFNSYLIRRISHYAE